MSYFVRLAGRAETRIFSAIRMASTTAVAMSE